MHTAVHIVCTGGQSVPRNRSLPSHLEIRRSGYYWRRRLPRISGPVSGASAAETGGPKTKPFLCLSLRTHLPADAKYLVRRLTEMSDRIFAAGAGTAMTIALETRTRMLETLARFEIEAFERARAIAEPRWRLAALTLLWRCQPPIGVFDSPGDCAAIKFPPASRAQHAQHLRPVLRRVPAVGREAGAGVRLKPATRWSRNANAPDPDQRRPLRFMRTCA